MPKVTYRHADGSEQVVAANVDDSVMTTAVQNGVDGIIGECGGNVSCATCHVWVQEEFFPMVGSPGEFEEDLLDMAVSERRATSRLSCQLKMTDVLDGLAVDVPPEQP